MGSLSLISKENARKVTVDEADNEIVDPNNVKETTDIVQTKKKQKKTLKNKRENNASNINEKFKLK